MDTLKEPCPQRGPGGDFGFSSAGRRNPSAAEVRHEGGHLLPRTHSEPAAVSLWEEGAGPSSAPSSF